MTFAEILRNWPTDAEVIQWAGQAMEQNKDQAVALQKEQMLHGKAKDGNPIGKYRNGMYAIDKYQNYNDKAGLGFVDLKLTGAFFNGIYFRVEGDEFIFDSRDSKTEKLRTQYRDRFFGLSEEYRARLSPNIQSGIVQRFANKTGLRIV